MKQNKYDDVNFFSQYKQMTRSLKGLEGAGEWPVLKALLPSFKNKNVLDLGCGFGWHCRYAREQQANTVVGVDISGNMLQKAREQTNDCNITYVQMPVEDCIFSSSQFDIVISSLAFHYIKSFDEICKKVNDWLKPGGKFIFSVEHPIFTSRNEQDWYVDEQGIRLHWPVDHYQSEGLRETTFLTENVVKYHRTVATYLNTLIQAGFMIKAVKEPAPTKDMAKNDQAMLDEDRRPMFLIVSVEKN